MKPTQFWTISRDTAGRRRRGDGDSERAELVGRQAGRRARRTGVRWEYRLPGDP